MVLAFVRQSFAKYYSELEEINVFTFVTVRYVRFQSAIALVTISKPFFAFVSEYAECRRTLNELGLNV